MMLADMGAEVIRIDRRRPEPSKIDVMNPGPFGILNRGRRSVAMDLKKPAAIEMTLRLVERADALIEGFRPGVMERLGLGPDACLRRNPRLVYGRVTGWGQDGPLALAAGHDINYIALAGVLHQIGRQGTPPTPPINLVGDFGGGGMLLAFGMVCALLEAQRSGVGQVVDAAMVDGAAALMAIIYGLHGMGTWRRERGTNFLDGGAPWYDTYECADGRFVAVGAIEPQFYALLLDKLGIADADDWPQWNTDHWARIRQELTALFKTRTREEWCALLEGTDACFAPVLDLEEAPRHPHNRARRAFVDIAGVTQPAPAPRFSRTPPDTPTPPAKPGEHTLDVLRDWGIPGTEIEALKAAGAI
jgi:alpha-methylacyl-CoA racemase